MSRLTSKDSPAEKEYVAEPPLQLGDDADVLDAVEALTAAVASLRSEVAASRDKPLPDIAAKLDAVLKGYERLSLQLLDLKKPQEWRFKISHDQYGELDEIVAKAQ